MRPPLPKRPHLAHEAGSVFKRGKLNARPALRLDHTRQLEAEISFRGFSAYRSYASEI